MDESDAEILESVLPDLFRTADEVPPVVVVANDESATDLMRDYLSGICAGNRSRSSRPNADGDAGS
jgi:hypothetical protein